MTIKRALDTMDSDRGGGSSEGATGEDFSCRKGLYYDEWPAGGLDGYLRWPGMPGTTREAGREIKGTGRQGRDVNRVDKLRWGLKQVQGQGQEECQRVLSTGGLNSVGTI